MFTTATMVFLSTLAATLTIGAASYLSRGAVRRGAFILAMAACLVALSVLTIYPALKLTHGGRDDNFKAVELEHLKAERDQLAADLAQKIRDNDALSKTSAFFSKLHKERLTRIADEIRGVKEIVLGPKSGMQVATDTAEVQVASFLDGPSGFDAILSDLHRLKSLHVRSPLDPAAPVLAVLGPGRAGDAGTTGMILDTPADKNPVTAAESEYASKDKEPDTLSTLRRALDSKMVTASYRVEPLSDTELVGGRKGRYYLIELKNPKSGERFTFESGKYTFQASRAAYKAAFNVFASDVLKQLEGNAPLGLFVRGSADAQAYNGQLEPGFEYRKISYLPSMRGKYLANPASVAVPGSVRNTDLPNLRGEYLRGFLAELYPMSKATVLEGTVVKKDNPSARNTELILFVAWPQA